MEHSRWSPWLIRLSAIGLGGAANAIFLPYGEVAIFVIIPLLVYLLDAALPLHPVAVSSRARSGAFIGWCFAFGYFVPALRFLGTAYGAESGGIWKMLLLGFGLPAYLAIFFALGFAIAAICWSRTSLRVVALAFGVFLAEWLRSWILTGFSLVPIGQVALALPGTSAILSVTGVFGASALVVLVAALPVVAIDASRRRHWSLPILIAVPAIAMALSVAHVPPRVTGALDLRLVQTNIPSLQKWNPEQRADNLARLIRLTNEPRPDGSRPTHVIWPETALAFFPEMEPTVLDGIMRQLNGAPILIVGGLRAEQTAEGQAVFNSLYVGRAGRWSSVYDKRHLLPTEEYLPGRSFFDSIGIAQWIMPQTDEMVSGTRSNVITIPDAPAAAVAICYEVLFGQEIMRATEQSQIEPQWLLVASDNSLYAMAAGSAVLLSQSRLRAAEMGLKAIQAANFGASAVISEHGEIEQVLVVGVEGVIDAKVPLLAGGTIYSRNRLLVWWATFVLLAAGAIASRAAQPIVSGRGWKDRLVETQ